MQDRLSVKKGHPISREPRQAINELSAQIRQENAKVVIFFCSSEYDLNALGAADYLVKPLSKERLKTR